MGFADAFIITLHGKVGANTTINVFQYESISPTTTTEDLFIEILDAFENQFFGGLDGHLDSDLFHTAQTYTQLSVYRLSDPAPFLERTISYAGLHGTSEILPPFVSYSVRSAKKSRGIRRGFKRFAGVPELASNGGSVAPNFLADLQVLAGKLGNTMQRAIAPDTVFQPVVIKRVQYITPGGTIAYRFPESVTEYAAFVADDWEARPTVTTQNSRKTGVGV